MNKLESPRRVIDEASFFGLPCDCTFKFRIASFAEGDARKQVIDQTQEKRFIFVNLRQKTTMIMSEITFSLAPYVLFTNWLLAIAKTIHFANI